MNFREIMKPNSGAILHINIYCTNHFYSAHHLFINYNRKEF